MATRKARGPRTLIPNEKVGTSPAAKRRERLTSTDIRRKLSHAAEINAALSHFRTLSNRELILRRNAHVRRYIDKNWPDEAIEHIQRMSPEEYRTYLINRLFHRHAD